MLNSTVHRFTCKTDPCEQISSRKKETKLIAIPRRSAVHVDSSWTEGMLCEVQVAVKPSQATLIIIMH